MKIGVDISQLVYINTGVANYLSQLIGHLLDKDRENEYILFFSSLRGNIQRLDLNLASKKNVSLKKYNFPPGLLDLLWNKMHVMPIEWLIGDIDVFITSDWTEPPSLKAKKISILYDLIVYTNPQETDKKIIQTQKRKLKWAVKEDSRFICISESTKKDAEKWLNLSRDKLEVVYPGVK